MKHASEKILCSHSGLLAQLRAISELNEKRLGVYYKKSRAFLHFHEDEGKLFADVRLDGANFHRLAADSNPEQKSLLSRIQKALK